MSFIGFCTVLFKKHLTKQMFAVIILKITLYGGENMAVSTIDRVREAELKADEMIDAAEREAARLEADAQVKAEEIIKAAKAKADAFDKAACDEAKLRAAEIVKARGDEARLQADALTDKTLKLKQNVINKLIEETLI